MVKRVFGVITCFVILAMACVAMAGGAVAPAPVAPCAPAPCGPAMGNPCAYWGDAPFPGLCGGVVALPFLVVGSLLGGSSMGPGPAPVAVPAPYGPRPYYGPPNAPMAACGPPAPAAPCGPAGYPSTGLLSGGLPCLELCSSIFGSFTGAAGLGMY